MIAFKIPGLMKDLWFVICDYFFYKGRVFSSTSVQMFGKTSKPFS